MNEKLKQLYKPCTVEANEKGECVKPCQLKEIGICDGIKFVEVQDEQTN